MSEDNSNTTGLFTPGPTFDSAPAADKERQAIESLRGYAFQIVASTLAWLDLVGTARLYLEVAEDYSIVAAASLKAVQVKDTSGSGPITLKSQSVRDAVAAYVDLVSRNPERTVQLHYLTTSQIAPERRLADRPAGEAGLLYWRKAATAADVKPLRAILEGDDFSDDVRAFVRSRDDDAVRRYLLRNIHWQCGQSDLASLLRELQDRLVVLGTDRYRLRVAQPAQLANILLYHVLSKSVLKDANDRVLTRAELDSAIYSATSVTLDRSTFEALTARAALALPTGLGPSGTPAPTLAPSDRGWLVASTEIPPLRGVIARPAVKNAITVALAAQRTAILVGATGVGKSLIGREVAQETAGDFVILDVRDATAPETRWRLDSVVGRLGETTSRALIIEDINHLEDPSTLLSLSRVLNALTRRDRFGLITCYRPPSARSLSSLGLDRTSIIEVPYFSEDEVKALVKMNGADPELWTKITYLAGGIGHPQLVHAFVMGMKARGWPREAMREIMVSGLQSEDVEAARDDARRRLVAALPDPTKTLLYRLSLVIGRFDRKLALDLGALAPPVTEPGEQLDHLLGSWVEVIGRPYYRVSPLAGSAGREVLTSAAQEAVHHAIATQMLARRKLDVSDASVALAHALLGRADQVLFALAVSVLTADVETRDALRDHLFLLRSARTDILIYPSSSSISRMLRLAQFKLLSGDRDDHAVSDCVAAMLNEVATEPIDELRHVFETLALGTVLNTQGIANYLQNWVRLIVRFINLAESGPTADELRPALSDTTKTGGASWFGVLFTIGATRLSSVQRLEEILADLGALPPAQRAILLDGYERGPGDYHMLVSSPWLAQQNNKTLGWAEAASRYARMAERAYAWGVTSLAAECHAARAVMLDEYGDDPDAALRALDEAVASIGDNTVIARARAKILWRHDDHAGAVAIMRRIADQISRSSPVARCFALREAAISAAKTNDWPLAERWFDDAKAAAEQSGPESMRPMAIGLGVDAAVASVETGKPALAIKRFADSLVQLRTLDPQSSLRAAYCHRVTRHAVLWLGSRIEDRKTLIDNRPIEMPPGTCSNPEPLEAIKDLPLGPIDYAWYMLAEAEILSGEEIGIASSLRENLASGPIPIYDVMLRSAWMALAIGGSNPALFVGHFVDWLGGLTYLHAQDPSYRQNFDAFAPPRGDIPKLLPSQFSDDFVIAAGSDAVLAFLIVSVIEVRPAAFSALVSKLETQLGPSFPGRAIVERTSGAQTPIAELDQVVMLGLLSLRDEEHLEPMQVWALGLRLFERCRQSNFKRVLIPLLAKWMRKRWSQILAQETFRLFRPLATVPSVEAALGHQSDDERFVAALCLASADAVSAPLSASYRAELRRIAAT